MKKFLLFLIIITLGFFVTFSSATAQDSTSSEPSATSIKILILGTKHFGDFESIKSNLQKSKLIHNLTESVASQNHLELKGIYSGDIESVFADIKSLAADRFDVQKRSEKNQGLVVTLKKIAP